MIRPICSASYVRIIAQCENCKEKDIQNVQRDTRVSSLFVQKWCFSFLERDFSIHLVAGIFLFGANFQNLFTEATVQTVVVAETKVTSVLTVTTVTISL